MDNQEEKETKKPGLASTLAKDGIKSLWKKLPIHVKLYIIGGIAVAVLLVVIIAIIAGAVSSNYLSYSNDVTDSEISEETVEEEYAEYWSDLCSESSENCTEKQIKAANELKKSQTKFYKRLDSLVSKYELSKEQKYMVLTTIFFGYDIEEFTEGNGAFQLDPEGNDEINENAASTDENGNIIYKEEYDSLKELIKQFKVYTFRCDLAPYDGQETEDSINHDYELRDSDGKLLTLNFFQFSLFTGSLSIINPLYGIAAFYLYPHLFVDDFKEAVNVCKDEANGKIRRKESTNAETKNENFYNYLLDSEYFDKKEHLRSHYIEYADSEGLNYDIASWPEEDKRKVRESIVKDIKSIVEDYMQDGNKYITAGRGSQYWWPIGSDETTVENGVTFASGPPASTYITSHFSFARQNPTSAEKDIRKHDGTDIAGTMGVTNVIAALGGEVTKVYNGCASSNSKTCNGGYGNLVIIKDSKGNLNLYEHLYLDSITVNVGDVVKQGQVIGKVGSSGNSTGPHLHFTIKVNGNAVNPVKGYISAEDPRPSGFSTGSFNTTSYTADEFIAILNNYYSSVECKRSGCTSFKNEILNNNGASIIYQTAASHGINPEVLIARIEMEGYSPGSGYNYFGYDCTNTGGISECDRFPSFSAAMNTFFKNVSQYDSLESMMSKYAYIGKYWYTGKHSGWGGCYYSKLIYPDGLPTRVQEACSKPDGTCTIKGEEECVPTTDEDQAAYTAWQVGQMTKIIEDVFGG